MTERDIYIYPCDLISIRSVNTYGLGSRRCHQLLQGSHGQGLLDDEDALRQVRRHILVGNVLEEAVPVTKSLGGQADTLPVAVQESVTMSSYKGSE